MYHPFSRHSFLLHHHLVLMEKVSESLACLPLPWWIKLQNSCSFCSCRLYFSYPYTLWTFFLSNTSLVVQSLAFSTLKFFKSKKGQLGLIRISTKTLLFINVCLKFWVLWWFLSQVKTTKQLEKAEFSC